MKELNTQIKNKIEELLSEIDKIENKSAMKRSRKRTLDLEKLFKTFRKETLKKGGDDD